LLYQGLVSKFPWFTDQRNPSPQAGKYFRPNREGFCRFAVRSANHQGSGEAGRRAQAQRKPFPEPPKMAQHQCE
jgi:hypothetical protein